MKLSTTTNSLRVGFDLTAIWRPQTGIFRYATEVAKHLLLLENEGNVQDSQELSPSIRYVFFFSKEVPADFLPFRDAFDSIICPSQNELYIKQIWFPLVLPRLHLDLIHYPSFPPPYFQPFSPKSVMTFHDAGPWRYSQALTLHGRLYFRTLLAHGMHSSAKIITVSAFTKSEIKHFFGDAKLTNIAVVPEAARSEFSQPCDPAFKEQVKTRYHLPDRYFFTVSTVEPRKNLVTLLQAYAQLKLRLQDACPPLIIVGRKGWNCDDILSFMAELEGSVLFPGHVSDAELCALYQMATCLVFPSLYEGFGLPVLEAMTAGCPVITSNTSSLPEVAGDAALLVDPLNADQIAHMMQQLLQNDQLRASLVHKGPLRAAYFSWQQTARQTRDVYYSAKFDPHP
jgi:glycosyltransferase involved in cell wall biosynthesis